MPAATTLLDHAATLADWTRTRILLVLEEHELTVSELCSVLQLPQSTVSRHLKLLRDHGWVDSRREGTRRFYTMQVDGLRSSERGLWRLIREDVSASSRGGLDRGRLEAVLRRRRTLSEEFFELSAEDWDGLREELFGKRFDLLGLLALLEEQWVVGDLGCGSGRMSSVMAPFVRRVVAVDSSPAMLRAAKARLAGLSGVDLLLGDLESLPIDDEELDAATMFLVLHHVSQPRAVIRDAARVLKPGGRLVVVDMQPHDFENYEREMGHVWLGFSREMLGDLFSSCGFGGFQHAPLPADLDAKGPGLFVARARRGRKPVE